MRKEIQTGLGIIDLGNSIDETLKRNDEPLKIIEDTRNWVMHRADSPEDVVNILKVLESRYRTSDYRKLKALCGDILERYVAERLAEEEEMCIEERILREKLGDFLEFRGFELTTSVCEHELFLKRNQLDTFLVRFSEVHRVETSRVGLLKLAWCFIEAVEAEEVMIFENEDGWKYKKEEV
jgi:hypothetical protein